MARFFFIWMIMIGAMVGMRDGAHFDVDLWPELKPRANALLRIVSNVFILVFALVFIWYGIKFVQFGWNQNSELAELPMPYIFAAWPHGRVDLGAVSRRTLRGRPGTCSTGERSHERRRRSHTGDRRADPVRRVLHADDRSRAGRVCARPGLPAGDVHRAAAVADDPVQRDLQVLQLVHPARGAVFPAHREPDERGRHHGPAGAPVARPGRPPARRAGAGQRRAVDLLRRHLGLVAPPTRRARARSSSKRRSRKATTCRSRSPSPPCRRCWR